LTKFTTTLDTGLDGLADAVTGATGAAVGIVISTLDVTSPLVAVDEDDSVETGVAARPANTRGLDSQVVGDSAFTTTSLAAVVLLGSTFFETAVGEDPGGLAITLADIDDSSPVLDIVRGGGTSFPLVSPVLCAEVNVELSSAAVDWWPPAVPALPDVPELVRAPPVLTTAPGGADLVARSVVETPPDTDPDGVLLPVDESEELCVDRWATVEPDTPEAADALR
jgi:hypothetical protein